jgi:hypothetical protein
VKDVKFDEKYSAHDLWRYELKYRLNLWQYNQVKHALVPYMKMDSFSLRAPERKYLVRSLYYDSSDYLSYQEKVDGSFGRIKMRLRSYTNSGEERGPVRVELKTRRGNTMVKYCSFVSFTEYEEFLQSKHWPSTEDAVLSEFERLVLVRNQSPKLLVEYRREGYEPRDKSGYRVTFDHRVRSAAAKTLFPHQPLFRGHYANEVIMEVKCRDQRPLWLTNLMLRYGLKFTANSKYVQGVELACPDNITPIWSYN